MWFGYETLLLKNVPLLLMCIFFFGTFFLLNKLVQRQFVPPPEKRTWRMAKMLFLQMIVILLFMAALSGIMYHCVPPVAISEKTTYLTEPRTADGMELDVLAAVENRFAPKGWREGRPEDNGFRKVVELFGSEQVFEFESENRYEYTARFFRLLDMNISGNPPVKFQSTYDYFFKIHEGENIDDTKNAVYKIQNRMSCKPWHTSDIEASESWLAENADALDRFGEAVRMPYYYAPVFMPRGTRNLWFRIDVENGFQRNMVQAVHYRLLNSLAVENLDLAFYDMETLLRFADAQRRHVNSTMQFFHARTIQATAVQAVLQFVKYGHLSKERLRELDALFQRYRPEISIPDAIFLVRMDGTNMLYEIASTRICKLADLEWYQLLFARYAWGMTKYFPWNEIFAEFQENIDQLDHIAAQAISRKQLEVLSQWEGIDTFLKKTGENDFMKNFVFYCFRKGLYSAFPDILGKITSGLGDSTVSGLGHSAYRGITSNRQAEIAIALEFYRWDYGKYPESLAELQGIFLEEIPGDPYTDGEPFRYIVTENDGEPGYTLYSIGPDGIDDGGQNNNDSCICGGCDCDEAFNKTINDTEQAPPKRMDDIRIFTGKAFIEKVE